MATKRYESMRIMSLEGSVLYKNEGFTATKNGKPDPQAFRGVLDESLDTLKLAEVYARHEDKIGYPYLEGKKRFCRAVVNLSFNRAVKVYESYGNRYVLNGYKVRRKEKGNRCREEKDENGITHRGLTEEKLSALIALNG